MKNVLYKLRFFDLKVRKINAHIELAFWKMFSIWLENRSSFEYITPRSLTVSNSGRMVLSGRNEYGGCLLPRRITTSFHDNMDSPQARDHKATASIACWRRGLFTVEIFTLSAYIDTTQSYRLESGKSLMYGRNSKGLCNYFGELPNGGLVWFWITHANKLL